MKAQTKSGMKTKSFKSGKFAFKAYSRNVGEGFEVGLHFNRKPIFIGNFIHKKEAMKWWNQMNREVKTFTKKYWMTTSTNLDWNKKFFGNHLYKSYYNYLDKTFNRYSSTLQKAVARDLKKYNQFKKSLKKTLRTASKSV